MATADSFYPIEGIQDGLDPDKQKLLRKVELRMELDDWYQSPQLLYVNQRALFFPALWKFSQMKPQEKLSWFQIAGKSEPCWQDFIANDIGPQASTENPSLHGMSPHRNQHQGIKGIARTTVFYSVLGIGHTCFSSR